MQHKIANVPTHILNFFALPPPTTLHKTKVMLETKW